MKKAFDYIATTIGFIILFMTILNIAIDNRIENVAPDGCEYQPKAYSFDETILYCPPPIMSLDSSDVL